MQKLLSHMRAACQQYEMIKEGDKIAIGVSGGKDSMALLAGMANLRRFYPEKFDIVAITLDPRFNKVDGDYSEIEKLCKELDVEYVIKRTQLAEVIFDIRKESNPCSLCARMRRGALHDAAKEHGCNKIALGHHLDDVAETFIMNLFNGGTLDCFMPVTYLSRKDIYMIRPMIFARESDCARVVRKENLPVVKSNCPADGTTERQEVKEMLSSFEKKYGDIRSKILGAMQRKNINGY
ncbi:MAG: tRNA 2-thiocytidine biosynthesis TtcA family protein [Acutalibacteraceae bacterium]|nr:tRNA 2-thiocytidine biosynthesis TtcA family protein [Acutalibacteraceae bacterium]